MTTTDRPAGPPIGFLLRKLDRLIDEQFDRTLGARDVSRRQWQLLSTLAEGPATLDALDAAVAPFLDQTGGETAEAHLAPLVHRGLVADAGDGHELTVAGRALFDRLHQEVRATRARTVRGLTEDDYARTVAALRTMVDNLEGRD